ncbi:hypothetical protein [Xenorhabdus bovienii]|uniref:Uncharacterized protein n=3 Tax=Xenorhabdus bovienii TaxID=40576 RepID=A0A077P247_XENBV|nr:hypothetical protein [Xenorhabdus bovienii]CDH03886.1 conserved hypothetical protein [Xenorhabdus bovienii str. feltiae Moldova]
MWGFQTWDEKGRPNNSGVIPFLMAGIIDMPANTLSFSRTYVLPDGYELDYTILSTVMSVTGWINAPSYILSINQGTITASPSQSNFAISADTPKTILVFYKKKGA